VVSLLGWDLPDGVRRVTDAPAAVEAVLA
jgi:hypothetical protein